MGERRGRGEPAGLSTSAVVAAARRLVSDRGPGSLSMRAVARDLGVAPNALYAHIRDRDDLLDLVLDDVLGGVSISTTADAVQRVIDVFMSTYDVLVQYPAVVQGYMIRQGSRGPNAMALGDAVDVALDKVGLDEELVNRIRHSLIVQVIGFAAFAAAASAAERKTERAGYERALRWQLHGAIQSSRN